MAWGWDWGIGVKISRVMENYHTAGRLNSSVVRVKAVEVPLEYPAAAVSRAYVKAVAVPLEDPANRQIAYRRYPDR